MEKRAEIETQLFDVKDFALPQDDYGTGIKDAFLNGRDAIIRADGLVIVTPDTITVIRCLEKRARFLLLKNTSTNRCLVGVRPGLSEEHASLNRGAMVRELGLAVTFADLNFRRCRKIR